MLGVEAEIASPGSSPLGRVAHHKLDGLFHTFLALGMGRCFRNKPYEMWQVVTFIVVRLFVEQLHIGGISYEFTYHSDNFANKGGVEPSNWWRFMVFNADVHWGPIGAVFWGYAAGVLLSIALILVKPAGGAPVANMFCQALVFQLAVIIFLVFNPSANMIFSASKPSTVRTVQCYLAHAADFFAWNTPLAFRLLPPRWLNAPGFHSKNA